MKSSDLSDPVMNPTDYNVADWILALYGDDFICIDKGFYIYHNGKWLHDFKMALTQNVINKHLREYFKKQLSKISHETDPEKYKSVTSTARKFETLTKIKSTMEALITKLYARCDKIEFDSNAQLIAFENCAYDFIKEEFRPIRKDDYLTMSTGYDYVESTATQYLQVKSIVESIFPNVEIRESYRSILYQACIGDCPQKFVIANGNGRNGKGVLTGMVMTTLGVGVNGYSYKGPSAILQSKQKIGANPEIASMHNKRLVIFTEPTEEIPIQQAPMKEYSGGGSVCARQLYSNITLCTLVAMIIMECNAKPNMNGSDMESECILGRLMDIEFASTFTDAPERLLLPNHFPQDERFSTKLFQQEHASALFKYIIGTEHTKIYNPECVKQRTREYTRQSDEIFQFMSENYEPSDCESDYVKSKMYIKTLR